jgi:dTDP-4-amino-4,6-dideoxygalactose transaminase
MIQLFNINNYVIDTSNFKNILHDKIVDVFVENFCKYVGAKFGCAVNSATNAIFLCLENKNTQVSIPTMIPPVVANAIKLSGNSIKFVDDTSWVGNSYLLKDFGDYKIIDSAQRVDKDQFLLEANDQDLMIFSFYPTKPVGGIDGGIIVSNDEEKIKYLKTLSFNGMNFKENNWDREQSMVGWKMYLNSIQAYVALNNLQKLDEKKERLSSIRKKYNNNFNLQNSSDHLFRIDTKNRSYVMSELNNRGISTGIHYKCLHKNSLFGHQDQILKDSEIKSDTTLSIPFHEKLTDEEVDYVIDNVKSLVKN